MKVALIAVCLIAAMAQARAGNVLFHVKDNAGKNIQVRFYSQNRSVSWPSAHSGYDMKNGAVADFNLACNPGEKVCYAAWTMPDEKSNWGLGITGKTKCTQCCFVCGQTSGLITFNR
jgi:hypothetical protein